MLFLAQFKNNFGGGNKTYKLQQLELKTKYSPETVFFILRHILDFRYLKQLNIDLKIFYQFFGDCAPLVVIINKKLPLCKCVEHDIMASTK